MDSSLEQSYAHCRTISRESSSSFYLSFLTLPKDRYRDMCVLYAFMRHSDDIGDNENQTLLQRSEELTQWRTDLTEAFQGQTESHPIFPALKNIVEKHEIPEKYLFDVLDGIASDLHFCEFPTFTELERYCYQVAGAVGVCCIHIWGTKSEEAIQKAIACGTAFQLTNILRDLSEDLSRDRFYLPLEDLQKFDLDREEFVVQFQKKNELDERAREFVKFEIQRAEEFYRQAKKLTNDLVPAGRSIYSAMFEIYHTLLEKIAKSPDQLPKKRMHVSKLRKSRIVIRSMLKHRLFGK